MYGACYIHDWWYCARGKDGVLKTYCPLGSVRCVGNVQRESKERLCIWARRTYGVEDG